MAQEETELVKPRPQLNEFLNDDYHLLKGGHNIFMSNFALPYSTYIYKNFVQEYLSYNSGDLSFSSNTKKLRRCFDSQHLVSYCVNRNPLNKFYHVIKGYMFVPGISVQSLKAIEYYTENLIKQLKKDGKKTDPDLVDFSIIPQLNGVHFNIYGRLPALLLEKFSELQKAMKTMNSSGFVKLTNEDSVREDLGKESVLSLAHHQLMCALNLYSDAWQSNLSCNFLRLQDTSNQLTYSKVVLLFMGSFNVEDVRKRSEEFRAGFCYQRKDFYYPLLTKHGLIPPGRNILLKQTESESRNSSMLLFVQTRADPSFCEYYGVQPITGCNDYATAKIYSLLAHHFLQVEFFQVLRSQHAVGYHVYSRIVFKEGLLGVGYFIQSSENCPAVLGQKTLEYITQECKKIIKSIDSDAIKKGLRSVYTKPHDRLYEYPEIFNRLHEIFYQNDELGEYIKLPDSFDPDQVQITPADLQSFLRQFYLDKPSIMEVHVVGTDHKISQKSKLADLTQGSSQSTGVVPVTRVYKLPVEVTGELQLSKAAGQKAFTNWNDRFTNLQD